MPFFIENKKFPHPAWTKDNDGHGSLLDADFVDGYHFSDLEDKYVNYDGDRLTGDLLFDTETDVIKDACIIEYDFREEVGAVISNIISANYPCTITGPTKTDLTSGAHSFLWDNVDDYGVITTAAPLNNLEKYTLEFIVYVRTNATGHGQPIFSKTASGSWNGISSAHQTSENVFNLRRYTDTGAYGDWATPTNSAPVDAWYFVQISHDATLLSNDPIILINGIQQTLTITRPTGISWADDSSYDIYVGNRSGLDRPSNMNIALWRVHTRNMSLEEMQSNYNASKWRCDPTVKRYKITMTGGGSDWGLGLYGTGFKLYDWKRPRNILEYAESPNTISIGNSGTGFTINGSTIGITSAAGIVISGTTFDIDGTTFDIDGTAITIDGSTSLATTSPLTSINAATSVTVTTPTINLNGSTAVNINSNRILTIADKDIHGGIPQLDSSGNAQIHGNAISLNRTADGNINIYINDRSATAPGYAVAIGHGGTSDYNVWVRKNDAWDRLLQLSERAAPNGVAAIDGSENLVLGGAYIYMTRNSDGNVHIYDLPSGETVTYFHHYAWQHWDQYIRVANSWQHVITANWINSGSGGVAKWQNGMVGGTGTYAFWAPQGGTAVFYGADSGATYAKPFLVSHTGNVNNVNTPCFMIEYDGNNGYEAYIWYGGWKKISRAA
jgi:hypothetical protein